LRQVGQQRPQGFANVGGDTLGDGGAAAEAGGVDVDLDVVARGQEIVVREVGSQQQHEIGPVQRLVAGAVAEQPGHAHVEWVVVLHEILAPQGVPDRSVQPSR
jgi:hypothetical protein